MVCNPRVHVWRFMMVVMLAMQGLLAWHDSVHVLEDRTAHGMARHYHHEAGDGCDLCGFAQDFAKIAIWHAPVWRLLTPPAVFADAVSLARVAVPAGPVYTARAPPAAA